MERVLSEEEKIRKAIEISRRRNSDYYNKEARVTVNSKTKKEYRLFKKMVLQIIVCLF